MKQNAMVNNWDLFEKLIEAITTIERYLCLGSVDASLRVVSILMNQSPLIYPCVYHRS